MILCLKQRGSHQIIVNHGVSTRVLIYKLSRWQMNLCQTTGVVIYTQASPGLGNYCVVQGLSHLPSKMLARSWHSGIGPARHACGSTLCVLGCESGPNMVLLYLEFLEDRHCHLLQECKEDAS